MGPGTAFERSYVYAGDSPTVFTDPSGMRKQVHAPNPRICNTSTGRQIGAWIYGLNPLAGQSYCEAIAVNRTLKRIRRKVLVGAGYAAGAVVVVSGTIYVVTKCVESGQCEAVQEEQVVEAGSSIVESASAEVVEPVEHIFLGLFERGLEATAVANGGSVIAPSASNWQQIFQSSMNAGSRFTIVMNGVPGHVIVLGSGQLKVLALGF